MTEIEIEVYNTSVRIRDFWQDNAGDFPADSVSDKSFKVIAESLPRIEASGELQESNIFKAALITKENAFAELLDEMRNISRTARSIGVDRPEVGALFAMPKNLNNKSLISSGTGFYNNSEAFQETFTEYGLPADFRARLQDRIRALQTAISGQNVAKSVKTGATSGVKAELKALRAARKRLLGVIPNIYRQNPTKPAGWQSASRIARVNGSTARLKKATEPNS